MKRFVKPFSVVAMCLVMLVGIGSPALASSSANFSVGGTLRASASFTSDGETFRVTDRRADGNAVGIVFFGPQDGYCKNTGGNGTTKTCDFAWAEGKSLYYRILLYGPNGGPVIAQSANIYDVS